MATSVETVRALHASAVDAYSAARPVRARSLAQRALAQLDRLAIDVEPTGQDALRGRLLVTLALSESEVAGPSAGLTVLDQAQVVADRIDDRALAVIVGSQRGAMAIRAGRFAQARVDYAWAQRLIEHAPPFDQYVILANAATAHLYLGELHRASHLFEQAVQLARSEGFVRDEAKARHNLGYVEFLSGELPAALQQMDEAVQLGPDLPLGIPLLDRARVLLEAGLIREADSALAEAEAIFRHDRLTQDVAEVQLERAHGALVAGDFAAARRFAGHARDRFRRRGTDSWRRTAELTLLQADLAAERPGVRLIGPAQRLQAEFRAESMPRHAQTAALIEAEAQLGSGDVQAATDVLAQLRPPRRTEPISIRLHAHYVQARVEAAQGRVATASRRVHRALTDLAAYQASFGSLDLRTASAVHGYKLAELDIELALGAGRPAAVFGAAERARAVSSRLTPVRPPDDAAAADLLAELRQTIETLHATQQDRSASAPLLRQRRQLERQIVARTWTAAGDGSAVRAARLAEVRAALAPDDQTMVMYVQSGVRLWAVTVGERVRLHELGPTAPVIELVRRVRADLDVLAQPRLPPPLRGAIRASLGTSLAALDRALVMPLDVGPRRLVIVSTGVLGQLPWGSLPSLRGVPLVVAPAATKWLRSTTTAPRTGGPVAVAIAGPGLDRAGAEAASVGTTWSGAHTYTGVDATRQRFADAMSSADILHVAAHGLHQPENPLFSSVRMSDGPVFAHELDQNARAPQHVVLSACEVGLATVRPGDEALGLASVLLGLGARCVLAGVARISDTVAEATMAAYHLRLAAGSDSATALADALAAGDSDVTPPLVAFGAAWTRSSTVKVQ